MAYVRRKQVKGRTYYQVVETYRDGDKVRQRVLVHIGEYPTVEEALAGLAEDTERWRGYASRSRIAAQQCLVASESFRQKYHAGVMPPRPKRTHHYGPWAAVCQYWDASACAEKYDKHADGLTERLNKLRAVVANNVSAPGQR